MEKPVPLFGNVAKELAAYKRELTEKIWNRHVTWSCTKETIQQESVFQAFRMVGTITKLGDRVQAFRTGDRVSLDDLNKYVSADRQVRSGTKNGWFIRSRKVTGSANVTFMTGGSGKSGQKLWSVTAITA